MYAPHAPVAYTPPGTFAPEEVFEPALAHGDEHVIKLTDTALDVSNERALAAALRSLELSEPPSWFREPRCTASRATAVRPCTLVGMPTHYEIPRRLRLVNAFPMSFRRQDRDIGPREAAARELMAG